MQGILLGVVVDATMNKLVSLIRKFIISLYLHVPSREWERSREAFLKPFCSWDPFTLLNTIKDSQFLFIGDMFTILEMKTDEFLKHLFVNLFKKTLINPWHLSINNDLIKNNYFLKQYNLVRRMALYILTNPFNVWLRRWELESDIWFFIQVVIISYFRGPLDNSTVCLWENENEKGKYNVLILWWKQLTPQIPWKISWDPQGSQTSF